MKIQIFIFFFKIISDKATNVSFYLFLLYIMCHISLDTFKFLFLFLDFSHLILMHLGVVFFGLIVFQVYWTYCMCRFMVFIKFVEFSDTVFFLFYSSFSWNSVICILDYFIFYYGSYLSTVPFFRVFSDLFTFYHYICKFIKFFFFTVYSVNLM